MERCGEWRREEAKERKAKVRGIVAPYSPWDPGHDLPGMGFTLCQSSPGRGTEFTVGLDGAISAHPLPLCPPSPLTGCRGTRPLDVEMSEDVMRNGNKRIQTQVRLRGDREGGGTSPRPR